MHLGAERRAGRLHRHSATGFTTFNTSRGPTSLLDQMWIRFDVEQQRVRHRRQAARALGDGAVLAADRLPAPAEAQPAGRLRRARRDLDAEAPRPLGGHRAGTSTAFGGGSRTRADRRRRVARSPARRRAPRSSSSTRSWVWTCWSSAGKSRAFGLDLVDGHLATSTSTPTSAIRSGEDFTVVYQLPDDQVPTCQPTARPADRRRRSADDAAATYGVTSLSGFKTQAVVGAN